MKAVDGSLQPATLGQQEIPFLKLGAGLCCADAGRLEGKVIEAAAEVVVELGQTVALDVVHAGEDIATEQFLLQGLDTGALAERPGCPYEVGYEVQHERAQGDVGDILVIAVAEPAAPGAHIDGRTPAVRSGPVNGGGHSGTALPAAQQTGEDVGVLPLVGHAGAGPATTLFLEHGSDAGLPLPGDDGDMVVLDHDPLVFILEAEGLFALVSVVVAVGSGVEWVGQHGTDGGGVPGLAGAGPYALVVQRLGHGRQRSDGFVEVVDVEDYLCLLLDDAEHPELFVVGISEGNLAAVPHAVVGTGQHDGADSLGGHVALQLGKDQNDFQHGLTHS